MARKRKTLPKDFKEMLGTASLEELKAVFDRCELDARGGYSKSTAIGFADCPDELIVWLVEQGLDVDAPDGYGNTPLRERALYRMPKYAEQIRLLASLGANVDASDERGRTPLAIAVGRHNMAAARVLFELSSSEITTDFLNELLLDALKRTENAFIADMLEMAKLLFDHGATATPEMTEQVQRIGERFEFYRDVFNKDSLDETDAALRELYFLFDATPAVQRQIHDGVSPIVMPEGNWSEQYDALWEMLVPGKGKAKTVQGEVIRLSGKLGHEILDNGGINWNKDFRTMLEALVRYFGEGNALDESELAEAQSLITGVKRGDLDESEVYRLDELAVAWVARNPEPISLPQVNYRG
ncbi:ankyrin repeat protein [Gulosibacter sp. 10]|nr:ankyrin repeat protein [Gulosibacter sp. 10]